MDQLIACPDCGTPNRIDAELCVQCWRGMSDELAQKIPMTSFAPPPPPVVPRTLRPAPAVKKAPAPEPVPERESTPPLAPYFAPAAPAAEGATAVATGTVTVPTIVTQRRESVALWSFWHLALVGICAWFLPIVVTYQMAGNFEGRGMMDAALAIQVGGYLVGGLAVAFLVYRYQYGDWDSVGLRRTERSLTEAAQGFGLGVVLIASFVGGVYLVAQKLDVDGLVRTLVGATTGPGFVLGALVVVVGAPVIEEIYFRGMLFNRAKRESGFGGAVVVTTILFVLAHGSGLLDPPRLLLGLSMGLVRKTKSVWFTIGGHAAWNLGVVVLGITLLTGPAHTFTAADGSFSLRHPAQWDRMEEVEGLGTDLDLVLTTPAGAFIGVGRSEMAPGVNRSNLGSVLSRAQGALPMGGMKMGPIQETNVVRGDLAKTYESRIEIQDPMLGKGQARMVAVVREGSTKLMVAVMACPEAECAAADADFDEMLRSVSFSR
ncbi:MAG TPA: type II CAAX endopeptidase family protein [Actinomycetota bacterium]|nr:type II CAAX endopeptidase family protein [Actinomycetota bacterium]